MALCEKYANPNKPVKKYVTTTIHHNGCYFKKDFSALWNSSCLDCEFCYKNIPNRHLLENKVQCYDKAIESEKYYSTTLFKTPIVVSRLVDPLIRKYPFYKSHLDVYNTTRKFLNEVLVKNNGQIIFKTSQEDIPDDLVRFFVEHKDDVLIQLRVFNDTTTVGETIRGFIAPNFSPTILLLKKAEYLLSLGLDVAIIIDPYIIGINNYDVIYIIEKFYNIGIKKFIIKQLFATEYFKGILSNYVDSKYIKILCDNYFNKYYSYDNLVFLDSLQPILKYIDSADDLYFSICCNSVANSLICKHDNCCLFDNPIGDYRWDLASDNQDIIGKKQDDKIRIIVDRTIKE